MIDLKAKITKEGVVYRPRKKNDKKAALWAARLNDRVEPEQIKLFSLQTPPDKINHHR